MRRVVLGVLGLLACAVWPHGPRGDLREAYIQEFQSTEATALTRRGWSPREQIVPDDELFRGLRSRSPAGSSVRAVVLLNVGVHPRWTLVFTEAAAQVSVVATFTSWGHVFTKRAGLVDRASFNAVLERVTRDLECLPDPSPEFGVWLSALAYWDAETLFVCDVGIDGFPQYFADELERAVDEAAVTYDDDE